MFKSYKAWLYDRNMKMKDTQEVFSVSSFKLGIYVKIRTGISHHCMNNFNFNFTLSFTLSCTREQYDGLDIEINTVKKEREFITFIVCNCKHCETLTYKEKGN